MCVATLNVSLEPCHHRWYTLVESCSESTNLSNCHSKVKLKGWETRVDHCPWCGPSSPTNDLDAATHKLFGGSSIDVRRTSDSTMGSTDSLFRGRSNSISTFSAITSRSSSEDSIDDEARENERAERNRLLNNRLNAYIITAVPDEIPSRKAYMRDNPQYKSSSSSRSSPASASKRGGLMLGRWGSAKKKSR
ncbi:hypothetical protein K461DRAFT_276869 [Myriangium duriaei CBS 260.36]|uniref:Uncharacterized protein n=1 Tax=Myriangium duriaei CBS 260.36 TaxID=1168546 RepID=A0A9P4ML46_9PEZI|nr:hypothetical protein K461DRAFT_276869 [Myriangium duriaei CBS 260.36]